MQLELQVVEKPKDSITNADLEDEFCPDNIYVEKVPNDETLVEEIVIKPDGENDWNENDVENLIGYKLKVIGVNVVNTKIERNNSEEITTCLMYTSEDVSFRPVCDN